MVREENKRCDSFHYLPCENCDVPKTKVGEYEGEDYFTCCYWGIDIARRNYSWPPCGGFRKRDDGNKNL